MSALANAFAILILYNLLVVLAGQDGRGISTGLAWRIGPPLRLCSSRLARAAEGVARKAVTIKSRRCSSGQCRSQPTVGSEIGRYLSSDTFFSLHFNG